MVSPVGKLYVMGFPLITDAIEFLCCSVIFVPVIFTFARIAYFQKAKPA